MEDTICPTDCRFRNDLRCYEEGRIEESESEKNLIERRQRKTRKQVEDGLIPPLKPRFFVEKENKLVNNDIQQTNMDPPIYYELITGEKGYWERRKNKDWDD